MTIISMMLDSSPVPYDESDRRFAWIVGVASFLILLPGAFWGLPFGKVMVGGMLVAEGAVPYRDFWTMYAPGMYWLTGAIFRLFGPEVLYQAIASCIVSAGNTAMLYLLARRVDAPRPVALVVAGAMLAAFWTTAPTLYSYPLALFLLLNALSIVVRYHREGGVGRLFPAGLCIGLAAVFKHDISFYMLTAFTASLFLVPLLLGERKAPGTEHPIAATLRLAFGVVLVFTPAFVWTAWAAGPDAWTDLIVFPATDFKGVRGEGFPQLKPMLHKLATWLRDPMNLMAGRRAGNYFSEWALCHLPELVFTATVAMMVVWRRRRSPELFGPAVTFLLAMPFFYTAAHVQQNTHLISMAILSLLLGAMAWTRIPTLPAGSWRRFARPALLAVAAVYVAALVTPALMSLLLVTLEWRGSRVLDLPGMRWLRISERVYNDYIPISLRIREYTAPDERIYVGVERHDAIVINAIKFHYTGARRGATRYHELHPGITDRIEIQQEIIDDIERHGVRAVVIWKFGWSQETLDAIKARRMSKVEGIGATYLDEWIAENFEPIEQHGEYVLMWRKGIPGP